MKKVFFLLAVLAFSFSLLQAQSLKIAYINTDRVIQESNDTKDIQRVFNLDRTNWENQIKTAQDQVKAMESDLELKKLTLSEQGKKDAQAKIQAKKDEADAMVESFFGTNGKAKQRYQELIEPVTKKINQIIEKIAVDENYSMILDVSTGVVLYAKQNMDITDQIIAEINKGSVNLNPATPPAPTDQTTPPNGPTGPKTDDKKGKKGSK